MLKRWDEQLEQYYSRSPTVLPTSAAVSAAAAYDDEGGRPPAKRVADRLLFRRCSTRLHLCTQKRSRSGRRTLPPRWRASTSANPRRAACRSKNKRRYGNERTSHAVPICRERATRGAAAVVGL